ncbi:hypothetical protein EYC08_13025 [Tabrizicola sp. WMC-M-20]|nr:hypothetical protein EYC08_13025 [Tabrizicola sp. WMC-M-20]
MEGSTMGQGRHGSATTTHTVRPAIIRAGPPLVRGPACMIASFARAAARRSSSPPSPAPQPSCSGCETRTRPDPGPLCPNLMNSVIRSTQNLGSCRKDWNIAIFV